MASLNQNIIIFKNRYHILQFIVDGVEDLDGFEAHWVMSEDPDETPIIIKSTEGKELKMYIDGLRIIVIIDEDDFLRIPAGSYYHELVLIDANGKAKQGSIGDVELKNVIWKRK